MYHYYSLVMTSKGKCVVGDTLDTDGLNKIDYKNKYQQLQAGRRKWSEENQALMKNLLDIKAEKERDAQYFQQQIEQKERELQMKDRELQEKEREEAEKELRYVHQLQEKERQNTESK